MLFVGTSIIHPSTEGVFLLCNILDLLIYSYKNTRFCGFPCIFSSAYLARKAEICYIMHAEVFMPGAKKMPERDETK